MILKLALKLVLKLILKLVLKRLFREVATNEVATCKGVLVVERS